MSCEHVRSRLTAYLDGELEGDRGSAIRGHLRSCDACRAIASDEAKLRDGLRALPPLDPPASLWAGVQRQLAAAEVEDSRRPAWRRAVARLGRLGQWLPAPRVGLAAAALAIAAGVIVWKVNRGNSEQPPAPPVATHDTHVAPPIREATPPTPATLPDDNVDVAVALASLPARTTATLADTTEDLVKVALEQRVSWSDDRKQVFDAKLLDLRHAIDVAPEGRARQKAYRAMIRYLTRVTSRYNEVAFADVGGAP